MYAEKTNTGYNLIDLSRREILIIKDSLRSATLHGILLTEENVLIGNLMDKIKNECPDISAMPPKIQRDGEVQL